MLNPKKKFYYQTISVSKNPGPALKQAGQKLPKSCTDYALIIQIGDPGWPSWVPYGADSEDGPNFLPNYFDGRDEKTQPVIHPAHPYTKSARFLRDFFHYFVPEGGLVIDAFAGGCSSLYGAVSRGCSLVCVEKDVTENENLKSFKDICLDVTVISHHRLPKKSMNLETNSTS